MALTFYTVFSRNDLLKIFSSMQHLNPFYFICAIFSAVFFVCMEGFMIWYLLKLTEKKFPCSVAFRILLSVFLFRHYAIRYWRAARPVACHEKGPAFHGKRHAFPDGGCRPIQTDSRPYRPRHPSFLEKRPVRVSGILYGLLLLRYFFERPSRFSPPSSYAAWKPDGKPPFTNRKFFH